MASVTLNLSQFKASGIYTIEIDQSQNLIVQPSTVRLVVGFSKQGPFNTPVFCPDLKTAQQIFGNIDTTLERKGSFFHRSLFTCVQTAPCFALNLLILNNDLESPTPDEVNYIALSVNTTQDNGTLTPKLYSSFYNQQQFWFPDPLYFLATESVEDKTALLSFVNLGTQPTSVIAIKSADNNVTQYQVQAKAWYTNPQIPMPQWMDPNDYISDFFVDVTAVQGDWTNYAVLSQDPVYSAYFTSQGFIRSQLNAFLSLPEVTLVMQMTGCLIPDFQDQTGTVQYIQTIVNNATGYTGIFCAVNEIAFDDNFVGYDQLDLVGNNLISNFDAESPKTSLDFLSYNWPLISDYVFDDVSPSYVTSSPDVLEATHLTQLYEYYNSGLLTNGDYIITEYFYVGPVLNETKVYLGFVPYTDGAGHPYVLITAYDGYTNGTFGARVDMPAFGSTYSSAGVLVPVGLNIVAYSGNQFGGYNEFMTVLSPDPTLPALNNKQVIVSGFDSQYLTPDDLIVCVDVTQESGTRLSRITSIQTYTTNTDGFYPNTLPYIVSSDQSIDGRAHYPALVTCDEQIYIYPSNQIQRFQRIQDYVQNLNFIYLAGFTIQAASIPDGSDEQMYNIYNVMYNTNIAIALTSKDVITWRYLVDTFNGGITPMSKFMLSTLCMNRQFALAIINCPSAVQFQNSTDPVFTDPATASQPLPTLDTAYIAEGGNLSLNPTNRFTLPNQQNGAQYAGFFFPNIVLLINGRNLSVPPAAWISNLFVQKFITGQPYAIVAGPRRGVISDPNLVGVDYNLLDADRDNLEPVGINPIVNVKNVGVMIYGNDTAFQTVNDALNNLHVRDLLITIESDIVQILTNYLFEFNDASTRLEISTVVSNYLAGVLAAGGIYNFSVVMDTSNNTPAVIDANTGIIDIGVEPVKGLQKIINRITIFKTGGISTGGFTTA